MDMRKPRGALLRVSYSVLRLIAVVEAMLETNQKMGPIGQLTGAGRPFDIACVNSATLTRNLFKRLPGSAVSYIFVLWENFGLREATMGGTPTTVCFLRGTQIWTPS